MTGEIKMSQIKGLAVEGRAIANMKDKGFRIVHYRYEEFDDLDNPEKKVEKLVLGIVLTEGTTLDYFPNKTSQKTLTGLFGYELDNWIEQVAEFEVTEQKVRGETKHVLYVKGE